MRQLLRKAFNAAGSKAFKAVALVFAFLLYDWHINYEIKNNYKDSMVFTMNAVEDVIPYNAKSRLEDLEKAVSNIEIEMERLGSDDSSFGDISSEIDDLSNKLRDIERELGDIEKELIEYGLKIDDFESE